MTDQERWYREQMGTTSADRQIELAKRERGECICKASLKERSVKKAWDGAQKATVRAIHQRDCPKWKPWMNA